MSQPFLQLDGWILVEGRDAIVLVWVEKSIAVESALTVDENVVRCGLKS